MGRYFNNCCLVVVLFIQFIWLEFEGKKIITLGKQLVEMYDQ